MRISTDPKDPVGYQAFRELLNLGYTRESFEVFLDGFRLANVITADDMLGQVTYIKERLPQENGEIATTTEEGHVTIRLVRPV